MSKINIILNKQSLQLPNHKDVNIQEFALSSDMHDSIYIGNCLSFMEYNTAFGLINQCLKNINVGGFLIIQNLDMTLIANKIVLGEIDYESVNKLLAHRNSYHSIYSVLEFIDNNDQFVVYEKDIENLNFVLKIKKVK